MMVSRPGRGNVEPSGLTPCESQRAAIQAWSPTMAPLVGDLDQIAVGVAEVDRLEGAAGARALDRSLLDGDAPCSQVLDPPRQRLAREQAHVGGPRRRPRGLGVELPPGLVQVDLLGAESQRRAPLAEDDDLHAQHALVKLSGGGDVAHGEDEVVEPVDLQTKTLSGRKASASPGRAPRTRTGPVSGWPRNGPRAATSACVEAGVS